MSQTWCLPGDIGYWAAAFVQYGIPAPPGWPTAVSDAEANTGYPAIASPVTVDQAAQFTGRIRQASINLALDFGGGDTWLESLALKRFTGPNGTGVEIGAGDERLHLTTPFVEAGEYAPRYYGSGLHTIDADNSLQWSLEMWSEYLWFDYGRDIAFFNLAVRLDVAATINGNEYLFTATQTASTPDDQLGGISLLGSSLTLYGTQGDHPYTFALTDFAGTAFFPYARNDGSVPIWDATSGALIGDPNVEPS